MRRLIWAALALWLGGAGFAHGAGVHYIIIPIIPIGQPTPIAEPIQIPMEITDAPLSQSQGVLHKGEVIAVHTLRALDSIVLLEPVQGRRSQLPAGRVLTNVTTRHGQDVTSVYCDLNIASGAGLYKWDCFADSQGAGKLDGLWEGLSGDAFLGFWTDASELNFKSKLANSAAYRKATADERSTGEVGYGWCGGDAIGGPAKFMVTAHWSHDGYESAEANACAFGTWADSAGTGLTTVDRITATIHAGAEPHTLAYKVESRIPPGPIAHFYPNGGIISLETAKAEADQEVEELKRPPFLPTGAQPTTVLGTVARGKVFYSASVKHSITGVLTNEVRTGSYPLLVSAPARPHSGLEPGQVMYGARVGGAIKPQIVWCAPIKSGGEWTKAICLPNIGIGAIYVEAEPAMMGAAHIRLPGHGEPAYAAAPMVERRDVDLPPMILSYAFAGWDKSTLKVETKLDWGAGAYSLQTRSWPADAAGVVHLPVVGGETLIKAIPGDEGSINVVSFTPGPAAPEPGEP